MITLEEIMAAINRRLKDEFNLKINDNDTREGFDRPSFFVAFDNVFKVDYLYTFERSLTVRIYYFPSNRHKYQLEILEVQQKIETLFKMGLTVSDRFIKIVDGIEMETVDGVLIVSFAISYVDSNHQEQEYPKMGGLEIAGD